MHVSRVVDKNINPGVRKLQVIIWGEEGEVFMDEAAPVLDNPPPEQLNHQNLNPKD